MAITTITLPSKDFTSRDFDSWIVELRSRVSSAFPAWNDFNVLNFGNLLLEMFAHTLDVLSFTQDQQFLETRVIFARLRKSMIALGKNVAFVLPGATVATVDLELTIADGVARSAALIVPKGTAFRTAESDAVFYSTADGTIPASTIQIEGVPAKNAQDHADPFVAPGTPGLEVPLGAVPYVDGSASAVIGVDTWSLVTDFFSSGPTDKVFRVLVDDHDHATLVFGDGTNGAVPVGAGTATYETGGGSIGNVEADSITAFVGTNRFATVVGEQVQILVRNPSSASGGVDRMSVEEARVAIPGHVQTIALRSVTLSDFEINARKVRGVARAMMLTSDQDPGIAENTGKLYIVPVGGGLPSSLLKDEVKDFITKNYPPTLTFAFSVEAPVLHIVSFSAHVSLSRTISHSTARAAVEAALDSFFSLVDPASGAPNLDIDFGYRIRTLVMPDGSLVAKLPWSDLFDAVRNATTPTAQRVFRSVDEDSFVPTVDVALGDTDFPILGSIALDDIDLAVSF